MSLIGLLSVLGSSVNCTKNEHINITKYDLFFFFLRQFEVLTILTRKMVLVGSKRLGNPLTVHQIKKMIVFFFLFFFYKFIRIVQLVFSIKLSQWGQKVSPDLSDSMDGQKKISSIVFQKKRGSCSLEKMSENDLSCLK